MLNHNPKCFAFLALTSPAYIDPLAYYLIVMVVLTMTTDYLFVLIIRALSFDGSGAISEGQGAMDEVKAESGYELYLEEPRASAMLSITGNEGKNSSLAFL